MTDVTSGIISTTEISVGTISADKIQTGTIVHEYDPQKAHEYYEQYVKKGLRKGQKNTDPPAPKGKQPKGKPPSKNPPHKGGKKVSTGESTKRAIARVGRLKAKTAKLEGALTEAEQALVKKRASAAKTKKANSDGKTTAKERQASKEYRDKNKAKIASKAKKASSKSGGSSSSSKSHDVSSMSTQELMGRISKIKGLLQDARAQLSAAQKALGSLAHSDILASEPESGGFVFDTTISRKESVKMTADFGGYATRNQVPCSDGRTILPDAFKDNDGMIVPLVWSHGHNDSDNILGHCKLENREDGVYAHAYFNDTPKGQNAKKQVQHGDLKFLSIFANNLVEKAVGGLKHVAKGNIREVSLVLAGANPGAFIDNVNLVHSDGFADIDLEEAIIGFHRPDVDDIEISHADSGTSTKTEEKSSDGEESLQDILDTLDEKQTMAVEYLLSQALTVESEVKHSDTDPDEITVEAGPSGEAAEGDAEASNEVEDEGAATGTDTEEDSTDESETDTDNEAGDNVQHDNNSQEDNSMSHNVFDQAKTTMTATATPHEQVKLAHSEVKTIMQDVLKKGSLETALQDYALAHGIENIEYLFPDAKLLDNTPNFISRRMEWVSVVLNGVRKTPFSRIKTVHADITADEARAKGYITGNMKNEEFFTLIKRETTPQTVYKKQKLDRDDVLDITDLDVIAFMKAEMKIMLDEEIASAVLVADGRSNADEEKIKTDKIRPISTDDSLYAVTVTVPLTADGLDPEAVVDAVIDNRAQLKGTGTPDFFTSEAVVGAFLKVKDGFGRRIYSDTNAIATQLRVRNIVTVDTFDRDESLLGIMVNLADYSIGTDRGGEATMFDDFDLDYNKLIYLLETRLCGALTMPKSALVFRSTAATNTAVTPVAPARVDNTVTIPTVSGVVYKDEAGNTLTDGSTVTLTANNTPFEVVATPASGKYFASNGDSEWVYDYEA